MAKIAAIFTAVSILNFACGNGFQGEVHLLPKGYIGEVIIAFGIEDGESVDEIKGKRLYRIPANGVLVTNERPNTGWIDPALLEFYYIDSMGNRLEQFHFVPWNSTDTLDHSKTIGVPAFELYTIGDSFEVTYIRYKIDTLAGIHAKYPWDSEKDWGRIKEALGR